jgi:hypothetical protein
MSVNLQVPIELIWFNLYAYGVASNTPQFQVLSCDIDPADYDGDVTLEFEVIAKNSSTSTTLSVVLNSGEVFCDEIPIPPLTTAYTLFRKTLPWFPRHPWVSLNESTLNLVVLNARLIITQVGATKTAIYYPMVNYDDVNVNKQNEVYWTHGATGQSLTSSQMLVQRNDAMFGGTPEVTIMFDWGLDPGNSTFTLMLGLSGESGMAGYYATTGQTLTSTETRWFQATISPSGDSWLDLEWYRLWQFMICPGAPTRKFYLHNAWWRIKVTDLSKFQVPFRLARRPTGMQTANQRAILDPDKFPANCRYQFAAQYYLSNPAASGKPSTFIIDWVGDDATCQYGAIADTHLYASGETWTKQVLTSEFWPPGIKRQYQAEIYDNVYAGSRWNVYNCQIIVGYPGPSPIDRSASFEVPIEMTDKILASSNATVTFSNTKVALDTGDYDGTVAYYLEIVARAGNTQGTADVSLIDEAGTVIVTAPIVRPGVQRYLFTPNAGLDYYRVKIVCATSGTAWYFVVRIVVSQKNPTKTRVYVPLLGDADGGYTAVDGYSIFQTDGTFSVANNRATLYLKDDNVLKDIAAGNPYRFEVVNFAGGSTASCVAEIYDNTAGADVAGTGLTTTGTTPTYQKVDFPVLNNGREFQLRIKRVGGLAASPYASIGMARLSIKLENFTKGDVWWRNCFCLPPGAVPPGLNTTHSLVYIDKRAYGGNVTYMLEASGSSTNTWSGTTEVLDESSQIAQTFSALTFGGTVNRRKRSGPFDVPSSGYSWMGNNRQYGAAGPVQQQSFICLYAVSGGTIGGTITRRPDFWPMFLGDLVGGGGLDGQEPNFGPAPRKPICT